ncbi:TonB-dependent receptor domain-containing protein, partial [Oleiphilus sp. HI0132]
LAIEMNYAFLNAEYDNYIIPPVVNADSSIAQPEQDASGDDMVASPAHKVSLAGQYFHDLPSGTLSYRLEYAWQDEQYFTAPNHETSYQGAYALVNARFGYESADEMWEAEVYVENLTNKAYSTSTREFPGSPLSLDSVGVTKDINPPRTFGLRLVRNF